MGLYSASLGERTLQESRAQLCRLSGPGVHQLVYHMPVTWTKRAMLIWQPVPTSPCMTECSILICLLTIVNLEVTSLPVVGICLALEPVLTHDQSDQSMTLHLRPGVCSGARWRWSYTPIHIVRTERLPQQGSHLPAGRPEVCIF